MKILILLISFIFSGCAYLDFSEGLVTRDYVRPASERDKLLKQAEDFFEKKDYVSAEPLYLRLSRFNEGSYDPVYDQALWRLAKIYEKNNQSEKAVLSLEELQGKRSSQISKNKIRFALMKNHYRISNYVLAAAIDKQIYADYKNKSISLSDLYEYLIDTTDLGYDSHLPEELLFLGEVQKYFIFVMESSLQPENEKLTQHLIDNYDHYFAILNQGALSDEFKKKLSISLYDQLNKFKLYAIDDPETNAATIGRFSAYCEEKQKFLTERFYQ